MLHVMLEREKKLKLLVHAISANATRLEGYRWASEHAISKGNGGLRRVFLVHMQQSIDFRLQFNALAMALGSLEEVCALGEGVMAREFFAMGSNVGKEDLNDVLLHCRRIERGFTESYLSIIAQSHGFFPALVEVLHEQLIVQQAQEQKL